MADTGAARAEVARSSMPKASVFGMSETVPRPPSRFPREGCESSHARQAVRAGLAGAVPAAALPP
jgi:hypothetical protein